MQYSRVASLFLLARGLGMRPFLVAGNWKMNASEAMLEALLGLLLQRPDTPECEVAVFPPSFYVALARQHLQGSTVHWGAQNVSQYTQGAFTGEVSAAMAADLGCRYVLVGHSERRQGYGENTTLVAEKFYAIQQAGLTPILCVGESLQEREAGKVNQVITEQLHSILTAPDLSNDFVIAYEPIWAIGTGLTATTEQAQQVHAFIRSQLVQRDTTLSKVRVLYGGSVKADNARALFLQQDIDGALVGGASLDGEAFITICNLAGKK